MQLVADVKEVIAYREVIGNFISQNFKVKYQRSILGFFWSMLNPALMMVVLAFVFSHFMKATFSEMLAYIYSGLMPWVFFSISLNTGCFAFIEKESFIKLVYLPKLVFPLWLTNFNFLFFLLNFSSLFVILFPFSITTISPALLFLPVSFLLLYFFVLGLVLIVSTVNVFFRDLSHLLEVFLQALFFLTPIIYRIEILPPEVQKMLAWNPMFHFVYLFRDPLLYRQLPDLMTVLLTAGMSLLALTLGYLSFKMVEKRIIFRL